MKSGIPWNLRGVDEETREAVLEAARRSGLSVGDWLNLVLADDGQGYAEPEEIRQAPAAPKVTPDDDLTAAIEQLRNRLDSIETQATRAPQKPQTAAGAQARAQKSVQEMVAELAREIENPDESARSMIEGLRARSAAPPQSAPEPETAPDVGRVSDAIRDLDQRIATMSQRIATTPPEDKPPRLDDIRYRLNALLAQTPKPANAAPAPIAPPTIAPLPPLPEAPQPLPQAALIDAALRALESRIDDAKARLTQRERIVPESPTATAEHIERVEARLAEISEKIAAAEGERQKRKGTELASAIREISAHQRTIDDRAETLALRRDQKALSATMAALRADIGAIGEQVNAVTRIGAEEHGALFEVTRRIDALTADKPVDRNLLSAIRADLETLRAMADGGARQATLGTIEERSNGIAAQINDLLIKTPDRSRVESLGEEVAALRRALESDDSPRAIQRLEMRVSELGRAIETTLTARQTPAQPDPALERLESRLQDIAGRIEGLRDTGSSAAAIATVEQRLEGRLAEIANSLIGGLMDTTSHTAAIETAQQRLEGRLDAGQRQLEGRLEEIASRLSGMFNDAPQRAALEHMHERLLAITERIDTLNASQREPSAALDAVKAEIGALRSEIAGKPAPPPPDTQHLEIQIRDLAAQLETVTGGSENEGKALADLEAQVAHLASELEQTKPRAAALHHVEESLDRLQGFLADTAQESIAGARAEARKAVDELSEMVAGNEVDTGLVRGLMRDLDSLRSAAGSSDSATRSKLESVTRTMSQVVDRLSRLEGEATSVAPTPGPYTAEAAPARVDTSSGAWTAAFREANAIAGRKDIATIPAAKPPAIEPRPADRRADFIAAARRAAQAAVAESASMDTAAAEAAPQPTTPPAERRPGAFARISQAIRSRKRPLLLAAAAIVLAIGAMQVYGKLSVGSDTGKPAAAAVVPAADSTSKHRDVAAETAPSALPTMPRVSEQAMVAPAATPDTALAFAQPDGFDNRFSNAPAAPDATGFGASDTGDALVSADNTSVDTANEPAADSTDAGAITLASAEAEPLPAPTNAVYGSGLDSRLGSDKLLSAADSGDPAAAFEIATRYADGTRVGKDLAKASEWYSKAAEGGVAVAQYRLGSLYERGQGVSKNLVNAVNWYQRAADQGNVNAMHNLAVLMSEGVEGPPDHDKALQWFLAAGNYGVRDSQYNLGVIYARGLGPVQDLAESYKWFAIAATQGDTDASSRRDEVAKAMGPDDLAKARAAVSAWHVKAPIAEANGVAAPGGGWDGPGDTLGDADRQALVAKIQTLLAEQGFDPGPADGVIGPKTVDAVRAYQRKVGQPETGQIDNILVAALADSPI